MSSLGWLAQPAVLPWFALFFGLCIGSFLNVVIHRLPKIMEREWRAECAELAGQPGLAAFALPQLRPWHHRPGERSRAQLARAEGQVFEVRLRDQRALPAGR